MYGTLPLRYLFFMGYRKGSRAGRRKIIGSYFALNNVHG